MLKTLPIPVLTLFIFLGAAGWAAAAEKVDHDHDHATPSGVPADAQYACPMETHPDQEDPEEQGAFFSAEQGKCPWCGMQLKPIEELTWAQARIAAGDGDVAYTCPDHQQVFSTTSGECPRCEKQLKPFKVMYTCPNPHHAGHITLKKDRCPQDNRKLVAFRGVWLDETMAEANVPPATQPSADAGYHCPMHPLVHSHSPGRCTICAAELTTGEMASADTDPSDSRTGEQQIPADAKYTCPMKECWQFSDQPDECAVCGMKLKPLETVKWVREMTTATQPAQETQTAQKTAYVCPMHPEVKSDEPGICSICAMQLVRADRHRQAASAPEQVKQQLDHVTEHYLTLQRQLSADTTKDVARHALGIAAASEEILKRLDQTDLKNKDQVRKAVQTIHDAALKITGEKLQEDRVPFVDLSNAMVDLLAHLRPDRQRWPTLYTFHCPMSKIDWVQTTRQISNPYYGFSMLKCGELTGTK